MWLVKSSVVIREGTQMNVCRDNNVTLLYGERERDLHNNEREREIQERGMYYIERERDNYNIRERHILQQRERELESTTVNKMI